MKLILLLVFTLSSYQFNFSEAEAKSLPEVKAGEPLPSNLFIELNKVVNPAVVNISTETMPKFRQSPWGGRGGAGDPMDEFLRQFFGMQGGGMDHFKPQPSKSLGTGFIIRKDGLILTNSHVIDKADVIKIQLSEKDEKTYTAKVIGKDPKTDVALIKIDAGKNLPTVALGKSSTLQVGEWVAAFGNPFGHGHSMSKGIVSAIGRDLDEINLFPFIQTDASINPGNSGGPLVNMKGEVIGVNTAIDARAQGIGFAIPIDEVKTIVTQLEKNGEVSRGFLGVEMRTMTEEIAQDLGVKQEEGAIVVNVVPGSAADRAGLKPYDIIVRVKNKAIKTAGDLAKAVSRLTVGSRVPLYIVRGGSSKTQKINVTIGSSTAMDIAESPPKEKFRRDDSSFNSFGFSVSDLNSKTRKLYEIGNTGKHKAYVSGVVGYSQASNAGLREGDVIYEINRKPAFDAKDVERLLNKGSKSFLIRVKRGSLFSLVRLEK